MAAGDQINRVELAYNGDIEISGTINGSSANLRISQKLMLAIIKLIQFIKE